VEGKGGSDGWFSWANKTHSDVGACKRTAQAQARRHACGHVGQRRSKSGKEWGSDNHGWLLHAGHAQQGQWRVAMQSAGSVRRPQSTDAQRKLSSAPASSQAGNQLQFQFSAAAAPAAKKAERAPMATPASRSGLPSCAAPPPPNRKGGCATHTTPARLAKHLWAVGERAPVTTQPEHGARSLIGHIEASLLPFKLACMDHNIAVKPAR